MKKDRAKGFILLTILLLNFCLLSLFFYLNITVLNGQKSIALEVKKEQILQLALAGFNEASFLSSTGNWTTDPAAPAEAGLKSWLLKDAAGGGSVGYQRSLTEGGYKVVKIAGHSEIYSIGFIGAQPDPAKYRVILKKQGKQIEIL
jgi:hypothetical protein